MPVAHRHRRHRPARPPATRRLRPSLLAIVAAVALIMTITQLVSPGSAPQEQATPPVEPTPSPAAPTDPPRSSALPWASGAASEDLDAFAAWRGRPLDVVTTWPNRETWQVIRDPDVYGAISATRPWKTLTVGIAMLPEEEPASFAECATGAYDEYYRDIGRTLVRLDRGDAIVRLGWEANGDWYAWSIGDDVEGYKECFRREVAALRSTAPRVVIDWNMNKESKMSRSVADAYPGDDVVDIVGVDFYDMYPAYPDRAAWDADYDRLDKGGPRGLGTWLRFARLHGKKLSVPEWGLNTGVGGGTDSPFYMQAMYDFFQTNADFIAYEIYFNLQDPSFMIMPPGENPAASKRYQALWTTPR